MSEAARLAFALVAACTGGYPGEPPGAAAIYAAVPSLRCEVIAHWPRSEWENAACAVQAESSWNAGARNDGGNTNGTNDRGLWQINSIHGVSDDVRFNWRLATEWARAHWERHGWQPWFGWQANCAPYIG